MTSDRLKQDWHAIANAIIEVAKKNASQLKPKKDSTAPIIPDYTELLDVLKVNETLHNNGKTTNFYYKYKCTLHIRCLHILK